MPTPSASQDSRKPGAALDPARSFQGLILALQGFWAQQGCVILQPYDMEVGAGTFHPATTLRSLGPRPWKAAYVQPSRRPKDGRYGENPNRLQHYYQFQVILKPSPDDLQDLYLDSLTAIGVDAMLHDVRFVEDDWESPTLGAWGLGWECWCDGMEVSQFTYFQQVAGFECAPVSGELTYGLERLAMYVQGVDSIYDINFNGRDGAERIAYGDVFLQAEQEYSRHNFEYADTQMLFRHFRDAEGECRALLEKGAGETRHLMALPAYDQCIKASHAFNLLDARGVISVTERQSYILRVRELAKACGAAWLKTAGGGMAALDARGATPASPWANLKQPGTSVGSAPSGGCAFPTRMNLSGGLRLACAIARAVSAPYCALHRSSIQAGVDSVSGTSSGSRIARRRIAFTNAAAEVFPALRANSTESFTAAWPGTLLRKRIW